jgi:conserved oligomeric Golgi complex subunit 4
MQAKSTLPIPHSNKPPEASVYKATSAVDIEAALTQLQERDTSIKNNLDTLIAFPNHLAHELGRLDLLRAHIGSQAVATRSISNGMLSNAAVTASRISAAVKRLDLEQSRVEDTLKIVEQVVELKTCVLGVTGSMGAPQDWETAAIYLSRASKIPVEIVDGPFAEELVPTAEVPDPPRITLENAAESLCGLFLREFEKAAEEGNGTKVTRFFKLFPLIGKPEVGLDVYGRYICQEVASRARASLNAGTESGLRQNNLFYADALIKLFEHIAQIVEDHGAIVDTHYGVGRMVRAIERLQLEADVQGGIVIDTWSEERSVDRRLTEIRSYAFTFLVQSFLPGAPTKNGTPGAGSPVSKGVASDIYAQDEGHTDMKAMDGVLNEMAIMLGRWSLYKKFITFKCKVRNITTLIWESKLNKEGLNPSPSRSATAVDRTPAADKLELN